MTNRTKVALGGITLSLAIVATMIGVSAQSRNKGHHPRTTTTMTLVRRPTTTVSHPTTPTTTTIPTTTTAAPTTTSTPASSSQPDGVPGTWTSTLSDSFSGTSLNTALWNTQYPWGPGNNGDGSTEAFLPKNTSVNNGLTLTATKGTVDGQPWSSGQVNTYGKFNITYGVLEIRAKVACGSGTWPAFWALPQNGSWPPEVDAMEIYGDQPNFVDQTYHWGTEKSPQNKDLETKFAQPLCNAYHVYTVDIEPSAITWYVDGAKTFAYTDASKIAQLIPLYVVADLDMGGSGGTPGAGPYSESISYIKAWKAS